MCDACTFVSFLAQRLRLLSLRASVSGCWLICGLECTVLSAVEVRLVERIRRCGATCATRWRLFSLIPVASPVRSATQLPLPRPSVLLPCDWQPAFFRVISTHSWLISIVRYSSTISRSGVNADQRCAGVRSSQCQKGIANWTALFVHSRPPRHLLTAMSAALLAYAL
jgi:hypothetical protein